jgi:hypothetical protein
VTCQPTQWLAEPTPTEGAEPTAAPLLVVATNSVTVPTTTRGTEAKPDQRPCLSGRQNSD